MKYSQVSALIIIVMDYFNLIAENQQQPVVDFKVISFLSDEDFEYLTATKRVADEAIDWCNLPMNIIYRVHTLVPIQTKWGAHVILELRSREGEEIKVWAPGNVSKDLKSGMKLKGTDAYIKSLGQKETKTSAGIKKRYFDFETVYI